MGILCCQSTLKPQIFASALPNNSSPSLNSPHNSKLHIIPKTRESDPRKNLLRKHGEPQEYKNKKLKPGNRPSVLEIESAIGSGVFRDGDGESDERSRFFDNMLGSSVGKSEGSVEKKLRKTGEWIINQTERNSQAAGKQILMTLFLWILPMWIVAFLLVVGVIQLPFTTPFLENMS